MSTTPAAVPAATRLVIAGTDSERVIHIQDMATLRAPEYAGDVVEITIGGETCHIAVLADEAVIVTTVRRSERWALAASITPLLGPIEGGGR